jgi:polyisoprenoid-binding protein YceI
VVSATYQDPANLEGATAELEIDLASLASGSDKRDNHLRSTDYLDVGAHPKAQVKVSDVKRAAGDDYTATADVNVHGISVKMPVKFSVIDKQADAIRVRGEHTFSRLDLKVGKPAGEDSTAEEVKVKLELTLKKG